MKPFSDTRFLFFSVSHCSMMFCSAMLCYGFLSGFSISDVLLFSIVFSTFLLCTVECRTALS